MPFQNSTQIYNVGLVRMFGLDMSVTEWWSQSLVVCRGVGSRSGGWSR